MVKIKYYYDNLTHQNICTPQAIFNSESRVLAYRKDSKSGFTKIFGVKFLEIEDDFQ